MDKTIYYNQLYDQYQPLLTKKQQQYFEDYYFSNLSLSEMAENYQVSRNAIYGQLKLIEKKLDEFEEKLQLAKRKGMILDLLKEKIDEKTKEKLIDLL